MDATLLMHSCKSLSYTRILDPINTKTDYSKTKVKTTFKTIRIYLVETITSVGLN